jgi:lysophospholipase L1-like esterase
MHVMLRRALLPALLLTLLAQLLGTAPAGAADATRILVVGDSITQGSSGDYTWRYRLWKHLQADAANVDFVGERTWLYDNIANVQGSTAYAAPNFDQAHHAKWGQQLQLEKDEIAPAVAASSPDVMLLLMGINDLTWGVESPETAFVNMQTLLRNAKARAPGLRVVVGHVLTRWDLLGQVEQNVTDTAALNALIDTLPSMPEFAYVRVAATNNGWNPQADTWDGTHPNSTGEVVIAAGFADALAAMRIGGAYGARTAVQWPGTTTITTAASTATVPASTPGTPTGVAGQNLVNLSWGAASGATGYLIQQRQAGQDPLTLSYAVPGTSLTPGYLQGDKLYDFRAVPVNDNGMIHLVWNATPGANAYAIRSRDLTTGAGWVELPLPVQATTYDLAGAPDHVYSFEIQPGKGVMTGAWSPEASQLIRKTGTPSAWSEQYLVKNYFARRQTATEFAVKWADPAVSTQASWWLHYGLAGNDCTHFVSETLLYAGFAEVGQPSHDELGAYPQPAFSRAVSDLGSWWRVDEYTPIAAGKLTDNYPGRNASATFTLAPDLVSYFVARDQYGDTRSVDDPRQTDYGDVIFFSYGADAISHVAVVTGFDSAGWPLISEHTDNAVNKSLRQIIADTPDIHVFPWRVLALERP